MERRFAVRLAELLGDAEVPPCLMRGIAYLNDRERQGLQKFMSQVAWPWTPLLTDLARQVGEELGEPDGVLVLDPSAFPKKGAESVGVQRQWCGRLGKIDNCQVGIYLAYVTRREHALVNVRLYLPEKSASKKKRRRKAGVGSGVRNPQRPFVRPGPVKAQHREQTGFSIRCLSRLDALAYRTNA